MSLRPDELEDLPFPPGESPFKMKGVAYRGHMEYAEAHVPGGAKAMIAGLRDTRLRAFFAQPFLAASRYDILPIMPAGRVCARLLGKTYADYLMTRARFQATSDLTGIYSLLLKVAEPESVATRLPAIMSRYLSFGSSEVHAVARGVVKASSWGMPAILVPWYQPVASAYATETLLMAGARNPRVMIRPAERHGQLGGIDLLRIAWDVTWDPDGA